MATETKDHHAARVLPVPIRRVAEVLTDPAHKPEWVSKLGQEVVLEKQPGLTTLGQPKDWIIYQNFPLPFPFSPRDYVLQCNWTEGPPHVFSEHSITRDSHPPREGTVRAQLNHIRYTLTELAPDSTRVDLSINVHPMGNFACSVALANMYGGLFPRKNLELLEKQCLKQCDVPNETSPD